MSVENNIYTIKQHTNRKSDMDLTKRYHKIEDIEFKGKKYTVVADFRKNQAYYVFELNSERKNRVGIIDYDDFDKIKTIKNSFFMTSKRYIYHKHKRNKKTICTYLHNIVMEHTPQQRGTSGFTCDHLNRITRDNRKENIRLVTQSEQEHNKDDKKRKFDYSTINIDKDQLITGVSYAPPTVSGKGGNRFILEIRLTKAVKNTETSEFINGKLTIKDKKYYEFEYDGTRSTKLRETVKYELMKKYIRTLYEVDPIVVRNSSLKNYFLCDENIYRKASTLQEEFYDIIETAGYCEDRVELKDKSVRLEPDCIGDSYYDNPNDLFTDNETKIINYFDPYRMDGIKGIETFYKNYYFILKEMGLYGLRNNVSCLDNREFVIDKLITGNKQKTFKFEINGAKPFRKGTKDIHRTWMEAYKKACEFLEQCLNR